METGTWNVNCVFTALASPSCCPCVCVQGGRDTPSARAAQLGPQTLVNLFNSPLYSDVIFMVQGGSLTRHDIVSPPREETPFLGSLCNYYPLAPVLPPHLHSISVALICFSQSQQHLVKHRSEHPDVSQQLMHI